MKLFNEGILETVILTAFFLGVFAAVCAIISVAVMLVIHSLEAVDEYKKRKKRGW